MLISMESKGALPRYRSHKTVHAAEIVDMVVEPESVTFELKDFGSVTVERSVIARFYPEPGDYYIVYADGYQSVSPKAAFEEGYTLVGPYEKD